MKTSIGPSFVQRFDFIWFFFVFSSGSSLIIIVVIIFSPAKNAPSIVAVPLNTRSSFCFWLDCVWCVKFRFIHIPFFFFSNEKTNENEKNCEIKQICDSNEHIAHMMIWGLTHFLRTIVCTVTCMLFAILCDSSRLGTMTNVWYIHKNGIRISKTPNLKYSSSGSIYCVNLVCLVVMYFGIYIICFFIRPKSSNECSRIFSCYFCHRTRTKYKVQQK